MKYVKSAAFVALAGLVSACGGGSGGSNGMGGDTPPDRFSTFDGIVARGETLLAEYGDFSPTDVANVPTAGSATYTGVVEYSFPLEDDEPGVSEIQLNANFDDSSVDGAIYNFRNQNDGREEFYAAIRDGSIDGNAISADIAGSFEEDGDTNQIDGSLSGNFVGDEAEAIVGTLELNDLSNGDVVDGQFGATR